MQTRSIEVLDFTSLTGEEVRALVPPLAAMFQAHMAAWRLDGQPRTARRDTTEKHCPLPTPEDRLLFVLVDLKTYPLQVGQGRLCGMGQRKAPQWRHVLWVVLQATWRTLGAAPTRSVQAVAQRLGGAEADMQAMVAPPPAPPTPAEPPAPAPASPLVDTMGPSGASRAPRIRWSRRAVIVASKRAIR